MVGPEERKEKLRSAANELHSEISLQPDGTLRRAYEYVNLALVERLLGETASSVLQARHAVAAATEAVINELEDIRKNRDSRKRNVPRTAVSWPAVRATAHSILRLHSLRDDSPARPPLSIERAKYPFV